jgi:AcrR family transcriptional regulator
VKNIVKKKVQEFKKNTILEEVSIYFEEKGYNNATIQDISQHIGISVGSLYKLFTSKEELYYAYIAHQRKLFYTHLENMCRDKDSLTSLKLFVTYKFEAFRNKKMAFLDPILGDPLYLVKLNMSNANPLLSNIKILENWFKDICIKENLKETDSLKLAYLFNATINGYVEYWLNGGLLPENVEEIINHFISSFKD